MDTTILQNILIPFGLDLPADALVPFQSAEDGSDYSVWKLSCGNNTYVLKEAKAFEAETYRTFFSQNTAYAPKLFRTAQAGEKTYLLMEYIPGSDLRRCDRKRLILTLDSLIAMQRQWWNHPSPETGYHYTQSLSGRHNRLNYLQDSQLEAAYRAFLDCYCAIPKTLCHDDLLPFNVLCNDRRAVFIDWEYGGILPYPTSLARLLAHGQEQEDAFFYLKEADRAFAVDYYYQNFICQMGISQGHYLETVRLFTFYEYCEWVYVGNRYGSTDSLRFRTYFQKAKALAAELGF